ncbi:hypothetical protein [Flavobacterium taihuense]|uniref:Uncharacterized protein n=1 Tax=Flavobacterium taihuense TaxID=2857508 RepID=A0ABS6Y1K8_9FLAO|nr:hypothetical protein [Flavobacterium taihuense]MBW4362819.1 hypothetical protein [Flavobacterium taihuense]
MRVTVKLLIEMLEVEDPNLEVYFGGLELYRLKDRGGVLQFEFSQSVYPDEEGFVVVENHLERKQSKPE